MIGSNEQEQTCKLENNKKFASSLVQLVVCSVNALAEIRCN